ncbi:hypothetical protein HPP92_000299 [Vanilla planifolia]|uniref:Uncharacterized protein n=1 Tax=Vanilla planifolia TaxID=51239 RepID=A0A835VIK9_VANPL|nr:hypothetical protein HPP92_000275 [Vanilla planifolia]KAG0500227.1 hypothetical protein HPP92_000299 [Vanilla planifolia]
MASLKAEKPASSQTPLGLGNKANETKPKAPAKPTLKLDQKPRAPTKGKVVKAAGKN